MKIAYLINQYPKVSHSFIRREIIALEAQGVEIFRYSIRPCPDVLVDEADRWEAEKTSVILNNNIFNLLGALIQLFLLKPKSWVQAFLLVLKIGKASRRGLPRHLAYLAEACLLWKSLKKKNISHIHAHFGTNSTTVALLCHRLGGITYSFTVHGPEEYDQPLALALPDKIGEASFVIAISSYGRSQLYRWCPLEQWSKIHVIRCGVDPQYLQKELQPVADTSQIVCVGRLCEQKGQLLLVQAVQKVVEEGIPLQLVLVGDGEMRDQISKIIEQCHLEEQVKITGWADTGQVQQYLLSSRAMVLPSFAEGLPVVIMESLALGRPVLSTYIAGIPELVEPEKSGWLVPAGSLEDLTAMLKKVMLLSPDQLSEMGKRGLEKVRRNHDVNLEARRLRDLLAQVEAPSLYSSN